VYVLKRSGAFDEQAMRRAINEIQDTTGSAEIGVGIKKILTGIETAKQDDADMAGRFARVMSRSIASRY